MQILRPKLTEQQRAEQREEVQKLRAWLSYNAITQVELSKHIGLAPKYLNMMLKSGRINPVVAWQVENATGGAIQAKTLCPQVFGFPPVKPLIAV